jgi:hypothetical protein
MWKGAVGRSWNADRNTVKVNPHIRKKRPVKRAAGALGWGRGAFNAARAAGPFP